jgi:rubrerythrin
LRAGLSAESLERARARRYATKLAVISTYQIFEKAEQLELASAEIYRLLAERFRDQPAASDLFTRLMEEELQHATRVRLLKARYRHDARLFENAELTSANLDALLHEGRQAAAAIARGEWGASLEVVKQKLAELEDRFGAAHAHVLCEGAAPPVRTFFEQLARQDQEHRKLLLG